MRALAVSYSVPVVLTLVAAAATGAHATSGQMIIKSNRTLTENHIGQIRFGANNITLDCAGHKISLLPVKINDCGATGAQRCGIHAANRTGITIKNCEVVGAYDYGVWIAGTTASVVDHVVARRNVTGFRIEDAKKLTVRSSTAISCTGGGFEVRDSSGLRLFGVNAVHNGGDGIDVNDSRDVNIQQAVVLANGVNGIEFDGAPRGKVGSSSVRFNGQHGISLDPSSTNVTTFPCSAFLLSMNLVGGNTEDGIRLQNCDTGFVRNNTAQSNGVCNARQDAASTGNTWTGNSLQNWCGTVPNPH